MKESGLDQILIGGHVEALLKVQIECRQTHSGLFRQTFHSERAAEIFLHERPCLGDLRRNFRRFVEVRNG